MGPQTYVNQTVKHVHVCPTVIPSIGRLVWRTSDNTRIVFGDPERCVSIDSWLAVDLVERRHIAAVYMELTLPGATSGKYHQVYNINEQR